MLLRLLETMDPVRFESKVATLGPPGSMAPMFREIGIDPIAISRQARRLSPLGFFRLLSVIRDFKPHIIQTWLYHAGTVGLLAGKIQRKPVCWSLHANQLDLAQERFPLRLAFRVMALLSPLVDAAVIVSYDSRHWHSTLAFRPPSWIHIPVGVDTAHFRPDPDAGVRLRAELGLTKESKLVGTVGRFHSHKDLGTFLRAIAKLAELRDDVHCVMIGPDITSSNSQLIQMVENLEIGSRMHMLGQRSDVASLVAGLDVMCLSSRVESCPTVLIEAMACGVPCVTTNAGDAGLIVGDAGATVPIGDATSMSRRCAELLDLDKNRRDRLQARCRARVEKYFSLSDAARSHEDLYQQLALGGRGSTLESIGRSARLQALT